MNENWYLHTCLFFKIVSYAWKINSAGQLKWTEVLLYPKASQHHQRADRQMMSYTLCWRCETFSDNVWFIHRVCPQILNINSSPHGEGDNLARQRDLSFIFYGTRKTLALVFIQMNQPLSQFFSRFNINLKLRWMWPVTWDASWNYNLHSLGIITLYVWPRTCVQQETPSHWEWWMESQAAFVYSETRMVRYRYRQIR